MQWGQMTMASTSDHILSERDLLERDPILKGLITTLRKLYDYKIAVENKLNEPLDPLKLKKLLEITIKKIFKLSELDACSNSLVEFFLKRHLNYPKGFNANNISEEDFEELFRIRIQVRQESLKQRVKKFEQDEANRKADKEKEIRKNNIISFSPQQFINEHELQTKGMVLDYFRQQAEAAETEKNGTGEAQLLLADVLMLFGPGEQLEAFQWYSKAVELGNPNAQYRLGMLIDKTKEDEKNDENNQAEAFKLFFMAAEQGHLDAQYQVGLGFKKGRGVAQDYKQAALWLEKSALQGHQYAQNNLASILKQGLGGIPRDPKQAFDWDHKAALQGLAASEYHVAEMYHFGNGVPRDLDQAFFWYQKAINHGKDTIKVMFYNLAQLLATDFPESKRDLKQAYEYYRIAAEDGFMYAQYELANLYDNGLGVEQDIVQAAYWYQKAAEQGHMESQFQLGLILDLGNDFIEKEPNEAFEWYKRAADAGHTAACTNVGLLYHYGQTVEVNYHKAAEYYLRAIANNDSLAHLYYAELLEHGYGCEKDIKLAVEHYRKSAELGNKDAQNIMGKFYEHGVVIDQDLKMAADWYRLAAENGNIDAQFNLANLYEMGLGVPRDLNAAFEGYLKASEQHHQDANRAFHLLFDHHKQHFNSPEFYRYLDNRNKRVLP